MSAPVDHPRPTVGLFVHYAETIFKSTACGIDRIQTAAADEKVFRIATKATSDLAEVTCPDCVRRALAPEMEALLRFWQWKTILEPGRARVCFCCLQPQSAGHHAECGVGRLLARIDEARRG